MDQHISYMEDNLNGRQPHETANIRDVKVSIRFDVLYKKMIKTIFSYAFLGSLNCVTFSRILQLCNLTNLLGYTIWRFKPGKIRNSELFY